MSDLISRKALIETIVNTTIKKSGYNPVYLQGCITRQHEILDMIERMPSFKPPKGEWIRNENPLEISCECSVCHAKDYWHDIDKYNEYYWFHRNFCPNCGADMRKKV